MILTLDNLLADSELQDEDVDDFKVVIPKKSKKHQLYSKPCEYRFRCKGGLKCYYAHNDKEKAFFKEHPNIKNRALYKSKACVHAEKCKYKLEGRIELCPFAHGQVEARCLSCNRIGSHWTDECPIPRDDVHVK